MGNPGTEERTELIRIKCEDTADYSQENGADFDPDDEDGPVPVITGVMSTQEIEGQSPKSKTKTNRRSSRSPQKARPWASTSVVSHFIRLLNAKKEILIPRKGKSYDARRIAWKKIANSLNRAHGINVNGPQCRKRYDYLKKIFLDSHLPAEVKATPGKIDRKSPWPYRDAILPIIKFYLATNPGAADAETLKAILGTEEKQGEEEDEEEEDDEEGEASEEEDEGNTSILSDSTPGQKFRWTPAATCLFIRLLKDRKEILFFRKPQDREKFTYGYLKRREACKQICGELNRVFGVQVGWRKCRLRLNYMKRVFMEVSLTPKQRIGMKSPRKKAWPFAQQFRPLMKFIVEQQPGDFDEGLVSSLQEDGGEEEVEDEEDRIKVEQLEEDEEEDEEEVDPTEFAMAELFNSSDSDGEDEDEDEEEEEQLEESQEEVDEEGDQQSTESESEAEESEAVAAAPAPAKGRTPTSGTRDRKFFKFSTPSAPDPPQTRSQARKRPAPPSPAASSTPRKGAAPPSANGGTVAEAKRRKISHSTLQSPGSTRNGGGGGGSIEQQLLEEFRGMRADIRAMHGTLQQFVNLFQRNS